MTLFNIVFLSFLNIQICVFNPQKNPFKHIHKMSTKINGLIETSIETNLKPIGRPGKFRTFENCNTWSFNVFPWSHGLQAIENILYVKLRCRSKVIILTCKQITLLHFMGLVVVLKFFLEASKMIISFVKYHRNFLELNIFTDFVWK